MTIIFLNGCTSAGKSSIAKALQEQLVAPYLLTGIDDAFSMIPTSYHKHPDGFFFDIDDAGLVRLNFGKFGRAALLAHQQGAAAMARGGMNLILDEVVLNEDLRSNWQENLHDLPVFTVGVHCDLAELARREIARGDRVIGQARGQYDLVHRGMRYDVEVDTTRVSAVQAATKIVEMLSVT